MADGDAPRDGAAEAFEVDLDGLPLAADPERLGSRDRVEVLVSRFAGEVRLGTRPSVDEYVARNPDLAGELRALLPLIEGLERWKSDKEVECLRRNLPQEFPVRRLGAYDIVRELGRGGMGIVFEAVHAATGRRVAIKLLPWRMAADLPRWQERFRREATTIASLQHPHIVPVYAFGQDDGYCYYVMQFVVGVSLDRVLRRPKVASTPEAAGPDLRPDDWWRTASLIAQAALALEHAHQRGVLHNDVKPANLLLDVAGRVIVTDFAIGRADAGAPGSQQQAVPGTLRYMAPERILGHSDARSDIYSLGATLYELVTRTPAFEARDTHALLEKILRSRPRRPRNIEPRIPRPLEAIVLQALEKDPVERYQTAGALAADLLRFVNGQRVHARRPGWWRDVLRRYRRWRLH